jgi:CDP-glycerol glycerophosphotransferase
MAEEQKMKGFRARLDYALKHNNFVYRVFNFSVSTFMKLWGLFVKQEDHMVIFSAHSRKYNDSPKAIYEYMLSTGKFKDFKMVWALEDTNADIPGKPIIVKADTPKYFWYTLKAKYWITCVNIERSLHYKKKSCKYLNTWHGLSINHCGNAVPGRKDFDFGAVDFMCYESDYHREILIRDFLAREEAMIPTGLPRNDVLYSTTQEEVVAIKKRLGLPLDKKLILYAPTWRDSTDNGASYEIKPPIDVNYWAEELKDDYIVLLRTHAYTTKLLGIEFNDVIRDYTSYPVINDLFKISDFLVSDYSSCIADFSILERPVVCFAYDYEAYCAHRGLYLDLNVAMPSGVKHTEQEVIEQIKSMDYAEECKKTKEMIKDRLTYIGGHATEICIEKMFGKDYLK